MLLTLRSNVEKLVFRGFEKHNRAKVRVGKVTEQALRALRHMVAKKEALKKIC